MTARTIGAAALTLISIVLLAVEIVSWPQSARFSPTIVPDARCAPLITSISEADSLAGLREGDRVLLPQMDAAARTAIVYRFLPMQTARANETIQLKLQRGNQQLTLPYLLRHTDSRARFVAQLGFKLFLLALGLFVLWRGRDKASLALGLWCLMIAVSLPDAWWGGLQVSGRIAGGALTAALWTLGPMLLYGVIESLSHNVPRRTILATRAAMVVTIAPALFGNTANAIAQAQSGCAIITLSPSIVYALFMTTQLVMLSFFILSYSKSSGLDRQRIRWVFWAFLISRFGVLVNLVNRVVAHPIHLSGLEWFTVMLFPLGCAYAILRHRIIDVGFVLNRTLVYTILTTLAVGVFILLENVLNGIAVGQGVSLMVELVVALGLGLSFNALHKKIERAIDRTLFRRKHQAKIALQRLSEEAAFMENADALLERATREIPEAIGARAAAVYERADGGYRLAASSGVSGLAPLVEIDDLAFVRLRKQLSQVDLSDVSSALGSDGVAFALAARGQLFGALVCGRRIDGETYAPDEIVLLRNVAHEVGAELHAIRARQNAELLDALVAGSIDLQTARLRMRSIGEVDYAATDL